MMKKCLCLLLALALLSGVTVRGEEAPREIYTVEELLAVAEVPGGSYILMNDLDMTGVDWVSPDFSGTFDGNGHALLNLCLSRTGGSRMTCYDGNAIGYSAEYCGLFATLTDAVVKNLSLINVRGVLEKDCPVFLGGIAGGMKDSTISGCTVTGCLELRAHREMFGMGGIVGYGWGALEGCTADVTLICVDTDPDTLDEQFLGGAYGAGFITVEDCAITLDGYISDHGFVHSGGVVGMYMAYPTSITQAARICGTSVTGKITFFEDNTNRRAYCKALIGETLYSRGVLERNTTDFTRDERFEYTRELRPCMCDEPEYRREVVEAGCERYGYTRYTCPECGYSYTDAYTLFSHNVDYIVSIPATIREEGLMTGVCRDCGAEFTQPIPQLEEVPTQTEVTLPKTIPQTTAPPVTEADTGERGAGEGLLLPVAAVLIAGGVAAAVLLLTRKKRGKFQR